MPSIGSPSKAEDGDQGPHDVRLIETMSAPQRRTSRLLAVFLLFCRIGACLMVIPGFVSNRVPVHVRLFIGLSVALALSPLLAPGVQASLPDEQLGTVAGFIGAELLTGAFIGFLGRIFLAALETLTTLVSMAIGLSNMPGMPKACGPR